MLTDFPKGFGFDPTIAGAGERASGYIAGSRRMARSPRPSPASAHRPLILVADEPSAFDREDDRDAAPEAAFAQSPFLTTALVGFLLAGAGYFVGFH